MKSISAIFVILISVISLPISAHAVDVTVNADSEIVVKT